MYGLDKTEKVPFNCVFCGSKAHITHYDDCMWYVHCSNPECKKHDKYAYLGSSKNNAIDQWNFINRTMDRSSTKTRKKHNGTNGDI